MTRRATTDRLETRTISRGVFSQRIYAFVRAEIFLHRIIEPADCYHRRPLQVRPRQKALDRSTDGFDPQPNEIYPGIRAFGDAVEANIDDTIRLELEECQREATDWVPVDSGQGRAIVKPPEAIKNKDNATGGTIGGLGS